MKHCFSLPNLLSKVIAHNNLLPENSESENSFPLRRKFLLSFFWNYKRLARSLRAFFNLFIRKRFDSLYDIYCPWKYFRYLGKKNHLHILPYVVETTIDHISRNDKLSKRVLWNCILAVLETTKTQKIRTNILLEKWIQKKGKMNEKKLNQILKERTESNFKNITLTLFSNFKKLSWSKCI